MLGRCAYCREDDVRVADYGGVLLCDGCEDEAEREGSESAAAEYEDARWDLAREHGYDEP